MKPQILQELDAREYGFLPSDFQVIYFKSNRWRIYEQSCYSTNDYRNKKSIDRLIEEVQMEKHVRRENIRIVRIITLIAEHLDWIK